MTADNEAFSVPETEDERIARLRALAQQEVEKESETAMLARFKAEARAARAIADGSVRVTDTNNFPEDYDRVEIFAGRSKYDQPFVPLGIAGFVIKVPRGEEVIIPSCFTEVLAHAVEEVTVQSQGGLVTRPSVLYPYAVKGKATKEEYKAYQAEQKRKLEMQRSAQAA